MAAQTRSRRPAGRPQARTVRYAPAAGGSSPAGFGSPRPSAAPARARAGGRTQQGASPAPRPVPASTVPGSRATPARRRRVRYEQPERIRRASAPSGNYQPVILAEFVGVILAIALAPVAKGEAQSQVSPYGGGDMVKLAAATLLFVVLGFVSTASQGAARIAAWFGGLTLIAVGLAEGAAVSKEIGLFTGNLAAAAQGQPSGGSPLSQGEAQAAYLQGLGAQEAATYGQGPFGQIGQAIVNAFGKIGPQGVPESLTGQGKPL